MIFVDTGAWFAFVVPTDPNHTAARAWLETNSDVLITTDYVVDETLTLLRARGESRRSIELGDSFFDGSVGVVYRLSETDLLTAWDVFRLYHDKEWSFTDCTSRVVMQRLEITRAIAFDKHFRQFGTVEVLP
jgi:predicted nucleic acid-binding protein